MELDLVCLASFLKLAELGHYGRAADALHLTPSALTKRVQRLEKQLGVLLFERGYAGIISMTPAGEQLAPHAASLIEHARLVRQTVRVSGGKYVVRLGLPGTVGDYPNTAVLARIRDDLLDNHPQLRVTFRGIPYGTELEAISDGLIDAFLTAGRLDTATVASVPVAPLRRAAVVPYRHELADARTIGVDAVLDLPTLRHPAAPKYLLDVFCLGDIRPLREARLVVPRENAWTPTGVEMEALAGGAILFFPAGERIGPQMRSLEIEGVPLLSHSVAYRRNDRREPTHALISAIRRVLVGPAPISNAPGRPSIHHH